MAKPNIEITKDQAKNLFDSGFWKTMSYGDRAEFQIDVKLLCMPFSVFHEAVEKTIGRAVYTHEFGLNYDGIRREIHGEGEAPTLAEIMALIPEDKRVILVVQK